MRYLYATVLLIVGMLCEAFFAAALVLGSVSGPGKTDYLSYDYPLAYTEEFLLAVIGLRLIWWAVQCIRAPETTGLFSFYI